MATILIPGFLPSDKVPGAYPYTQWGTGAIQVGLTPTKVLLIGNMLTGGTLTPNADIVPCYTEDEADTYVMPGSELSLMAGGALSVDGALVYLGPNTESAGAQAAMTVTFSSTWTAVAGSLTLYIDDQPYYASFATTDTSVTLAGDALAACVKPARSPVTFSNNAGAVTITWRQKGPRGNGVIVRWDASQKPTGMTITFAGGTVLKGTATSTKGMIPMTGGTTADSCATVLGLAASDTYDLIVPAPAIDITSGTQAGLVKTHLSAQADVTIQHLEHAVYAFTGTPATSTSFSQTNLNDQNSTVVNFYNCETYGPKIAAKVAGWLCAMVPQNPNVYSDGTLNPLAILPGIAPLAYPEDNPLHAQLNTMLSTGVTPLCMNGSDVVIRRGICSHSLNGAVADFRTYDWADVFVANRANKDLAALWLSSVAANPIASPDIPQAEGNPPEGVLTPALWKTTMYKYGKSHDVTTAGAGAWFANIDDPGNMPISTWDDTRNCIMSAFISKAAPLNYQIGILVRQA
jgi:phage tail sheath gpL-like